MGFDTFQQVQQLGRGAQIQAIGPEMDACQNHFLIAHAAELAEVMERRARLAQGESLDDILVEAFALVREASKRTIGLRHFNVQIHHF